jgi:type II secretory ATPase GspE/PulE/Tfp pilus assembly ATPase PilB-like protein
MDMEIEPFLINAAVNGVLAQRLVRKICPVCRVAVTPTNEECKVLDRFGCSCSTIYKGQGCNACLQLGYKGGIGIFELLHVTSGLRSLVVQQPSFDALYKQVYTDGMRPLFHDGVQKVIDGIITLQEMMSAIE